MWPYWMQSQIVPAAQAADRHFCQTSADTASEQIDAMAELCQAITLEFENVPADWVRRASQRTPVRPGHEFLQMCQDRLQEKGSLSGAGFPTTPFHSVTQPSDIEQAAQRLGWPLVLKTARCGYDGKGQRVLKSAQEASAAWNDLGGVPMIAEKWIEFEAEVSMLAARNARGDIECFPLFENSHANHILDLTRCPVSPRLLPLEAIATDICRGIAQQFQVIGLFCVEFFVTSQNELMINEIAPRPHNSGHLTIEAFRCSQFEQQVRAICNLPLVAAEQLRPAAMVNLLGDLWQSGEPNWLVAFQNRNAHLHLYGKDEARNGRKMGHLTVLDEHDAAQLAMHIRNQLCSTPEVPTAN